VSPLRWLAPHVAAQAAAIAERVDTPKPAGQHDRRKPRRDVRSAATRRNRQARERCAPQNAECRVARHRFAALARCGRTRTRSPAPPVARRRIASKTAASTSGALGRVQSVSRA
jgi:hypothetical protein